MCSAFFFAPIELMGFFPQVFEQQPLTVSSFESLALFFTRQLQGLKLLLKRGFPLQEGVLAKLLEA